MASEQFANELTDAIGAIQRIVNNPTAPAEAATAAFAAVERLARATPLPAPIAEPVRAKMNEALGHLRACLDACATPAVDAPGDAEHWTAVAERHRAAAVRAQTELLDLTRSEAQQRANVNTGVHDERWVEQLMAERDGLGEAARVNPIYAAAEAGDFATVSRLIAQRAEEEARRRSTRARLETPTDKLGPALAERRESAAVSKELIRALLNYDRSRRITEMRRQPELTIPEGRTVAAAAFPLVVVPAAGIVIAGALTAFRALYYDTLGLETLSADGFAVIPDAAILDEIAKTQGVWASLARFWERITEGAEARRSRTAAERTLLLRGWSRRVSREIDWRDRLNAMQQFYQQTAARWTTDITLGLDVDLDRVYETANDLATARGGPTITRFGELQAVARNYLATVDEVFAEVRTAQAVRGLLLDRAQRAYAEFRDYVRIESLSLALRGIPSSAVADIQRVLDENAAAPPRAAAAHVTRPAAVIVAKTALAVPVSETNAVEIYDGAVAARAELGVNTGPVHVLSLEDVPAGEPPVATADELGAEATQIVVVEHHNATTGEPSLNGDELPTVTEFVDMTATGLEALSETAGRALNALLSTDDGEAPLYDELPVREVDAVFDQMGDEGTTRGLAAGLGADFPPDLVLGYFAQANESRSVLLRLPQLVGYVGAIGTVETAAGARQSFASLVAAEFADDANALATLIADIEAAGNEGAFDGYRTLASIGDAEAQRALAYIGAFERASYRYCLSHLWHYRALVPAQQTFDSSVDAFTIANRDLPDGVRRMVSRSVTQRLITAQRAARTTCAETAEEGQAARTLLSNRNTASHGHVTRSRWINGAAFSPSLEGRIVNIDFVSANGGGEPPRTVDPSFMDRGELYQRHFLVRDTAACDANTPLADCPWTIVESDEALRGASNEVLRVDLATGDYAMLRIYDLATSRFGPALLSVAVGATRAAAGSHAAATNGTSAADFVSLGLGAPDDNSALVAWYRRLAEPLTATRSWFETLSDPLVDTARAFARIRNFFSAESEVMRSNLIALSALSSLTAYLELAVRAGTVVLNQFPRLRVAWESLCFSVRNAWRRLIVSGLLRFAKSALGLDSDAPSGADSAAARRRAAFRGAEAEVSDSLDSSAESLDEMRAGPALSGLLFTLSPKVDGGARQTLTLLQALQTIVTDRFGPVTRVLFAGLKFVFVIVGSLTSVFLSTITLSGVSASDRFQSVLNIATAGLIVLAGNTMWTHLQTFATAAIVSTASRVALTAAADWATSIVASAVLPATSEDARLVNVKRLRDAMILFGTLTQTLAPWLIGAEYTTIAALAPGGVAALAAAYDPLLRPSISTRFSGLTTEQSAVELAVFAGTALGRMWAPKLFGALCSNLKSDATREREASDLATSTHDAIEAFSKTFSAAHLDESVLGPVPATHGAYEIWAEIAVLAVEVYAGRWRPTTNALASQLHLVGIRLVDFLRSGAIDSRAGARLLALRRDDAAGKLDKIKSDSAIRNTLFAPRRNDAAATALAAGAIKAAIRDVHLELLAFECVAVKSAKFDGGSSSSSSSSRG